MSFKNGLKGIRTHAGNSLALRCSGKYSDLLKSWQYLCISISRISYSSCNTDNRFRWKNGSKPFLYGLWRLHEARQKDFIVIVEGESDSHTLWYHGFPAAGLPGANTWKEEWSSYFDGIQKIYVIIEPDSGGKAVQRWLSESSIQDRVYSVDLQEYKDPSGLHIAEKVNFKARFVGASVPESIRETVQAVTALKAENHTPITIKLVAEKLNLDMSATSRRVKKAIKGGYLINKEENYHKPKNLDMLKRILFPK